MDYATFTDDMLNYVAALKVRADQAFKDGLYETAYSRYTKICHELRIGPFMINLIDLMADEMDQDFQKIKFTHSTQTANISLNNLTRSRTS